ncbi:hypothetical protein ACJ72_07951 [Emergomyces africanus]|uniref:Uncharacterized protein n=1 Tax=Emergomyces africanus TaxID=1955775 RepID=A0A1B7NM37_9EURO|nr:hypothetical protein ACJ72_07951 [Emergomyces africanus]
MDPPHPNPTPSTAPAFVSPASLLWAHQLRREHNILVSRLDALEEALASYSAEVVASGEELRAELDRNVKEVESAIGGVKGEFEAVKAEVDGIKGEVAGIKEWKEVVDEREREEKKRREMDEEERKRAMGRSEARSGEVEKGFQEVWKDILPVAIPCSNPDLSDNDHFHSSSLPPIPQLHLQSEQLQQRRIPSTISGTPTITHLPSSAITRSSLPPKTPHDYSTILVPDSTAPAPAPPSSHPDHQADGAPALPTSPPQPLFSPITQPASGLGCVYPGVQNLRQGPSESLESYLSRGEMVLSGVPRREENRVVWALWQGVGDEKVKKGLGVELERAGWRWKVAKGFVDGLGGGLEEVGGKREKDTCSVRREKNVDGYGNGAVERRKKKAKKRRMIQLFGRLMTKGRGGLLCRTG